MTPQPLQPEDLMDLAEALRRAGYDIGTQQHVAAQDLVIALAAHGRLPADPRAWRGLLAPVFCSSPAEQDDFRQHFDQWLLRRPALARQVAVVEADSIRSVAKLRWFRRPRLLAATGAALLPAVFVAVYLSTNVTLTLNGKITHGENNTPIAGANIYFDSSSQPILSDDNGEFSIAYEARRLDLLRRKVSKRIKVESSGYFTQQYDVKEHPPQYQKITLSRDRATRPPLPGLRTPAPAAGLLPTPTLTPTPLATGWRESKRARAAVASLPLWLFALWWLWRRFRRRMLLQKLQSAGNPQIERIVVRGASERLFQGPPIRRAIQELRRHRQTQSSELDVPATVRATIRRAGMFAPVHGMRKTLPEYLLLVERAGPHDAQARLAGEICQRLEAGGVFVDRYEFQHDPRTCRRPEPASPALTLPDLAACHPDHCLLLFGDGAGLISPVTGEPERWVESFAHWEHRALLTPEAPGQWRDREESLAGQDFLLLPATEDGLASLNEVIQTGLAPKPNGDERLAPFPEMIAERPRRWIERQTPQPAVVNQLCDQLRDYLGDDGWQWLRAAAVYPAISWEITLYLGRKLLGERPDFEARLMRLVRLPWFRYGQMPDWLRSRLVESFAAGAPGQEDRVRRAIEAMLLGALESPPERLTDGIQLEIARAEEDAKPGWFERFKRRRRATRLGDLLQTEPDESPLRDYVFLGFLSGRKPAKLTVGLPRLLRRIFFPHAEPILGLRPLAGLALAVAVSAALWIGSDPPIVSGPPRSFAYVTVTLDAAGNETPRRTLQAGQYVEDLGNGVTIEMARIPGGEFQMGSNDADAQAAFEEAKRYFKESSRARYTDETPRHPVKVSPFLMGKYEVTQRQWHAVAALRKVNEDLDLDPSRTKGENLPVENVTWEQAKEFIARLNAKLGLNETNGYRLPSEAEWEYAARAGGTTPFAFGETINPSIVNYAGEYPFGKASKGLSRGKTVAVGSLGVANAWGLYDMHGNVWEWCSDWYSDSYYAECQKKGVVSDPRGPDTGSDRVSRGGGWGSYAVYCRSAIRGNVAPGDRGGNLGFRLVRVGP